MDFIYVDKNKADESDEAKANVTKHAKRKKRYKSYAKANVTKHAKRKKRYESNLVSTSARAQLNQTTSSVNVP